LKRGIPERHKYVKGLHQKRGEEIVRRSQRSDTKERIRTGGREERV